MTVAAPSVEDWLRPRIGRAPPKLRARIEEAVAAVHDAGAVRAGADGHPSAVIADALATAAVERLRVVLAADGGRGVALDLLAADALLTHAGEAAAEAGAAALEAFEAAYGPAGLPERLQAKIDD